MATDFSTRARPSASWKGEGDGVLLEVKGLKKHFPIVEGVLVQKATATVKAVDGVSFSIRKGETLGLLRSVPRLDRPRRERLDPIEGQPPDLSRLAAGCAFIPRCRFAVERCGAEYPPLEPVESEHHAACWKKDELLRLSVRAS